MAQPIKVWIDLVLDTGELVRIETTSQFEDEWHEYIENSMKLKQWLSFQRYNDTSATFMGLGIDRLNMARVVAML